MTRNQLMDRLGVKSIAIPVWTRWISQDADGSWWAYEAEPNQGDIAWYENEVGRYRRLGQTASNRDWDQALFRFDSDSGEQRD